MNEPKVVTCRACGQKTRVRSAADSVPHCPKCGRPLPWLTDADAADFTSVVEKSPIPVLIDFWAPWCAPCRIVAPAVERLSEELAGQVKMVKVNTDLAPGLQEKFGIRGIPTLVLMEGAKESDRVTGALNLNALRQWIEQRVPARSRDQRSVK
jgi:thioredoxin 2